MKRLKKFKPQIITLSLFAILILTVQVTLAFLTSESKTLTSTFKPIINTSNKLTIGKIVEHGLGTDYIIPSNIAFDFTIELGETYKNAKLKTSSGEKTADANGILKITLKPSEEFYIDELEEGTKVKVTEEQNKAGFTAKDNETTKEITISSTGILNLSFTNVYSPEKVESSLFSLSGKKILEGREWQEGDSFTFELKYKSNNEWISLGTKTITYAKDNTDFNKFDFTDKIQAIDYNKNETYSFKLIEVKENLEGVVYDETENHFDIVITDKDMDGKLEVDNVEGRQNIKVTKDNNNYLIDVTFNNTFKVEEPSIKYNDKTNHSYEEEGLIVVGNSKYIIETVLSKFEGLGKDYTYKVLDKNEKVRNDKLVRTGDKLEITINKKVFTYHLVLKGDVNNDGRVNIADVVKIADHTIQPTIIKEKYDLLAAEVTKDNKINIADVVKIADHTLDNSIDLWR